MSVDLLRRAAALMRDGAGLATGGPWVSDAYGRSGWQVNGAGTVFADQRALANDAAYVASWHPAVALAVADLLENEASLMDSASRYPDLYFPLNDARVRMLVAVARAYLGESA